MNLYDNTTPADDPYSVSEDARKEYDAAGSNLLIVPDTARNGKDGQRYWSEYIQLIDIKFEEPGVKTPEAPGDATFLVHTVFEVTPESMQDGSPSPNIGKRIHTRTRFNIPAWKRARENRGGKSGQATMTNVSFGFVKRFLAAADLDPELGMRPRELATTHAENLLGLKMWGMIKQGKGKGQDRESVEVSDFVPDVG